VPPQRGAFTVTESIQNSGPLAVTIEAITLSKPQQPGIAPWPLTPVGQPMYLPEYGPCRERRSTGVSLNPGQAIVVGISARLSGACHVPDEWTGLQSFYVQRAVPHVHPLGGHPLGTWLVFHEPEPRIAGLACP